MRSCRAPHDPASAFILHPFDSRVRVLRGAKSPMRFFAVRIRCGGARSADAACGFAGAFAPRNPRRLTLHDRIKPRLRSFLPWIRLGASECGHAQERPVTSSASASSIRRIRNGHASPCSMEAMFRYRLDPSRPGRANGPSLISPGGAPGVNRRSSQVCSRLRVADRFRSSRAHVPVRPTTRPDALYSGLTRR